MLLKNELNFEPDWEEYFIKQFCDFCKNRKVCPYNFRCEDMVDFLERNDRENDEPNLYDDDSENSA